MPPQVTKAVEIEVPPEVAQRARERSGGGESIEEYLLDYYRFEFDWSLPEE